MDIIQPPNKLKIGLCMVAAIFLSAGTCVSAVTIIHRFRVRMRQEMLNMPYHEGQVVNHVLGGKVLIIKVDAFEDFYKVRTPDYKVIWVKAYELQP